MSNNYTFIDASGATQTAASSVVAGAQQPLVQIASMPALNIVGSPSISGAVTLVGGFSSVSGVGIFNVNLVGNGSVLVLVPGSVATAPSPASVSGVGVFNTNNIGNGSVITVWKDSSVLAGLTSTNASVITTRTGVASVQVISGTGVIGSIAALQGTNPWVIGNSSVMLTQGINAIGSVATLQGTNPWIIGNSSVQVIGAMPPQSVSGVGLFNVNHTGNGSIIAIVQGSVTTVGGSSGTQYIEGAASQSVTGTAVIFRKNESSSVLSTVGPNSPLPVGMMSGTVTQPASGGTGDSVGPDTTLAVMNYVFNGTTADRLRGNTTIGALVSTGASSVITILQAASIAGTYAEDAGHADGDKGLFQLGVRNDNVASFASANLDYTPKAVDSAGRTITKPFAANEALVQGTGSTMGIFKSSLIGLSGTGLRNYLTDILIANTGSVATLVSFTDSDGSVMGKTIAPATGGSNIHLATPMRTGSLNSQVEFTASTGNSVLHVTGFGYKAP